MRVFSIGGVDRGPSRAFYALVWLRNAASVVAAALPLLTAARAEATLPVPSAITAYWDSANSIEWVIYVDTNGALQALEYNSGWSSTQLAAQGTYVPNGPLFSMFDTGHNVGRLFFLTTSGTSNLDVSTLRGNPPTTLTDLTTATSAGDHPGGTYFNNYYTGSLKAVYGTILTGFEDTNSTRYHHVFYIGGSGETRELYASGSTDSDWTDHQIASLPLHNYSALTSLWDGTYAHVYAYDVTYGGLYETYYNGSWWSDTLNTYSSYVPSADIGAWRPGCNACQVVEGLYSYNGSATDGFMLYDANTSNTSGWITESQGSYHNEWGCELAYGWTDNTYGDSYWAAGINGGCFYVGSDGDLYLTEMTNNSSVDISSGYEAPTLNNAGNSHLQNQVAGFFDGTYLHAFYVGADGWVYEAYCQASTISNTSTGTWYVHAIGGNGNAAH